MQPARRLALAPPIAVLLTLVAPIQAQQETYYASTWNGRLIYLSPATHSNAGSKDECQGNNENNMAYWIAWDATNADSFQDVHNPTHPDRNLLTRGYDVLIGTGTYQSAVDNSNYWGADLHIPIHSNWDQANACTRTTGNFGTVLMYWHTSVGGQALSGLLRDYVGASSPGGPDRMCPNPPGEPCTPINELYELKYTNAVAAYLEAEFHTWNTGVEWLNRSYQWAWRIGWAIDVHLGFPR